ncbi:MAG: hypothetical protein ACLP1X_04685 [Polyangiaceae bacterium]|jgi:hypothetical protein
MPVPRHRAIAGSLALGMLAVTFPAAAQVRWDVGAEVGAMDRLTTGRDAIAPSPTPGPTGELQAHVALIPMVRIGGYLAFDVSPVPGLPAREIAEGGVRVKVSPPLFSGPWRGWAFLGLGYARAYEPGHEVTVPGSVPAARILVGGAGGGILDLPIGVGIGYRLRRPWEIFAELESRIGLAFSGPLYARTSDEPYGGQDSFAVSLSVGVSWDE